MGPRSLLAVAMFALLQGVRLIRFPVPGPVLVVLVRSLLSALFDFAGHGIAVVGDIPAGLPALTLPRLAGLPLDTILLGAAAIFLVSFGAGIVTARSFGAQAATRSIRTANSPASAPPTSPPGCSAPSRSRPPTRAPRST